MLRAVGWGVTLGIVILGVAGRLAMRFYAIHDYQEPYATAGGTLTVLLAGAAAGAATGSWLWLGDRLFSSRPAVRHVFFWLGVALLILWVLRPVSQQRLVFFAPLGVAHGALLWLAVTKPLPSPNS
jgi:hypothetical protein